MPPDKMGEKPLHNIAMCLAGIAETGGDKLAVAGLTGRVTYRLFEDWTNDLANRINAAAGMAPKVCLVVAKYDVQAIVGMFATLKTPHIFLAVDGQSLPANIAGIAASTGAGVVVHDAAAAEAVRTAGLDLPLVPVGPAPASRSTSAPPAPPGGRKRRRIRPRAFSTMPRKARASSNCRPRRGSRWSPRSTPRSPRRRRSG